MWLVYFNKKNVRKTLKFFQTTYFYFCNSMKNEIAKVNGQIKSLMQLIKKIVKISNF